MNHRKISVDLLYIQVEQRSSDPKATNQQTGTVFIWETILDTFAFELAKVYICNLKQ